MDDVVPLLTPTATPTATPTITPIPTPTPYPTPTRPGPTPTPKPLLAYRGKIVFFSDDPDQSGLYAINPDGTGRQFIGYSGDMRTQFDQLLRQYQLSPDGRYRAYVTRGETDKQPQVYIQGQVNEYGTLPTWKVTQDFSAVAYDPMWSPDGARIVFVSPQDGSDDVWVTSPERETTQLAVNLTRNDWEWDKNPSWSPDSRRIVFWSNRTGVKQIFVMDADGRNLRNISNSTWDEYYPLWIR
jgi:TolB protein